MNNTKIEIINTGFPYLKKIVDTFQECLLNHSFWTGPPNLSPRLKKIKIILNDDVADVMKGSENYVEWTEKFNAVLINIPFCYLVKHNVLEKYDYSSGVNSDECLYENLEEQDFDLKKLNKFLNHEIGRIIDMLDPKFRYQKPFDNIEPRPYFIASWNCYIDGRLSRNKIPLLQSRQKTFNDLESIYGYSDDKLFNKIWKSNSFTYKDLIKESQKACLVRKICGGNIPH